MKINQTQEVRNLLPRKNKGQEKTNYKYLCLRCDYKWEEPRARIWAKEPLVSCPSCNHCYIKWTNYEEMFG